MIDIKAAREACDLEEISYVRRIGMEYNLAYGLPKKKTHKSLERSTDSGVIDLKVEQWVIREG